MSTINVNSVSEICKNFGTLASLPPDQRKTAIRTLKLATSKLGLPTRGEGAPDIHQIKIPGTNKEGAEAIEHALTHLQKLALDEEDKWLQLGDQFDQYVPEQPDRIDWEKEPENAWILVKTETGYATRVKGAGGRLLPDHKIPNEDLLSRGAEALGVDLKKYAGPKPSSISWKSVAKVAAVAVPLLLTLAYASMGRGAAAPSQPHEPPQPGPHVPPQPGTQSRPQSGTRPARFTEHFFYQLQHDDLPVECRPVTNTSFQYPWEESPSPWEEPSSPPRVFNKEACKLFDTSFFESMPHSEQVEKARFFLIRIEKLNDRSSPAKLRSAFNEVVARGAALKKVSGRVHLGRQIVEQLDAREATLGNALLQRYLADAQTPEKPGRSIKEIQDVFKQKSDQLKRASRLVKNSGTWLDSSAQTKAQEPIDKQLKELEKWKTESLASFKTKWEGELKTLQDMCGKATEMEAVEAVVKRLNDLSSEVSEGKSAFADSELKTLNSGMAELQIKLSKEIATKQAAKYREASIDTLSEMATSLIDNPQEAPKPNPFLERQTEALRSLPKDSPQREYYQQSLALQRRFDSHTRTIAKHLSSKPLTATSVEFLRAELEELDKTNAQMLKFYKAKEAKEDSKANLEPFRTAFVGARLAVAKEVTNSLGTMSATDRASVRPWVNKVLDDISPAVNEHLPDHQETIAELRTMAEGTRWERTAEWLAKKTSESQEDLWTPKSVNPFNR